MTQARKQAVSIRLGTGDIRKLKRLAQRLGVRDSDVIRFALKWTLSRVAPLCDPAIRGARLVPMFVETGSELIRQFELDAVRLDAVINDGAQDDGRVAHEDIALLALAGSQQPYAVLPVRSANGATGPTSSSIDALRQYLYDKYIYGASGGSEGSAAAPAEPATDGREPESRLVTLVAG